MTTPTRTPARAKPATKAASSGAAHDQDAGVDGVPTGPARYYNRELSWLQFNRRVLEESTNTNHPMLERVRFLSISASNLDEFYMVRAAGIYGQVAAGVTTPSQDGLTPAQQLTEINRFVAGLVDEKQASWDGLKKELAVAGINILEGDGLRKQERVWLETLFLTHVFPILTPIAVDPAHPFPFILNKGLTLAVEMKRKRDGRTMNGLIPIPSQLDRFHPAACAGRSAGGMPFHSA